MVAYLTSNEVSEDSEILLNQQTQLWGSKTNTMPSQIENKCDLCGLKVVFD